MKRSRLLAVMCLAGVVFATGALAQSDRTVGVADRDTARLVKLMDRDNKGYVTKQEYMDFMSRTFDRMDVNRTGSLQPQHLAPMTQSNWPAFLYKDAFD